MLHRLMCLFASLYGRFSTICVKQHSAGKRTCRMAFALLLVPLFVVPSFAFQTEIDFGFLQGYGYWQANNSSLTYEPWLSDFTAHHVVDVTDGETYNFYNDTPFERAVKGTYIYNLGNSVEIEFFITGTDVQFSNAQFRAPCMVSFKDITDIEANIANDDAYWRTPSLTWEFYVDGVKRDEYDSENAYLPAGTFTYDGSVENTIILKAVVNEQASLNGLLDTAYPYLYGFIQLSLQEYFVGNTKEYAEEFKLIYNQLNDINDNIEITNEYLVSIDNGIVNINQNVTDIKNQFENSNSNIWNAFGEKVESLVVPSEQETQAAIDGFNSKVRTKLGGLYDAYEIADNSINNFVSAFGVSTADSGYGFDFPGLSFPMNGTQITILPAQTVYIDNAAFTVFSNLLGNLVAFLCALAAFHISEDALICFLSGVSYWGFIRGRHDR